MLTISAIFNHRTLHLSGYCWIRSCMLMFFASQLPLVLFFHWLIADYALELSLPYLADFHCCSWMTPSWNACDGSWTLEGNRWPIKPIPQFPRLLWLKWVQNAALDNIYEVRLCYLTQNSTNNQSKIRKMLAVLFGIKCKKKCSRSKVLPKKVLALSVRDYLLGCNLLKKWGKWCVLDAILLLILLHIGLKTGARLLKW